MPTDPADKQREARWKEEAQFFDEWAERAGDDIGPLDPLAVARYGSKHPRRRFHKEFRFRLLGSLTGKRILDVGCGDGLNAVMLARHGATVTGIDVSPKAVELATRRAELTGVSDSAKFLCSPLETVDLAPGSFDVVWGDAVLHHLLADLDQVLAKLALWTKPSGMLLFAEPVNLNSTLRRIRFMVPVKTEATPDERPLERAEVRLLEKYIVDLHMEPFTLLGRLDRFVLHAYNYERSSRPRRAISSLLASIDYLVLRTPGLTNLAGNVVFYGRPRQI